MLRISLRSCELLAYINIDGLRVMPKRWDKDIKDMNLSDVEKDGLQVYRNYTKKFEEERELRFKAAVDHKPPDLSELREVLDLICSEDIRFVPVIACAFADEELAKMFKLFLPNDIPGGKKNMLGRSGPISSLFSRIQFAWAFDMLHSDILTALDKLREHRNKISHTWNPADFADFFETPLPLMDDIEDAVTHGLRKDGEDFEFNSEQSLRVRTIWLLARLFYESRFYPLAKLANHRPFSVLYGKRSPSTLHLIAGAAHEYTQKIAEK